MTFTESIKTVFGKYATFSGRASRSEFWWFYLLNVIISAVGYTCLLLGMAADNTALTAIGGLWGVYCLAVIIPGIAVSVRRIHDSNHSGWNFLWTFLPFLGGLIMLYFYIIAGTNGENKYGPDPLAANSQF